LKKRLAVVGVIAVLVVTLFTLAALATTSKMYFSSDMSGENEVTNVQEGDQVWICVYDPDENIDCDMRDKIWTDIKVMDPKTGAYIVWVSYLDALGVDISPVDGTGDTLYNVAGYVPYKGHYPGTPGSTKYDYLEETYENTGRFVSHRPFQIGGREDYDQQALNTHVLDTTWSDMVSATPDQPDEFQWGNYLYAENPNSSPTTYQSQRGWVQNDGSIKFPISNTTPAGNAVMPSKIVTATPENHLIGRFENMDTIVGMYQDQNDDGDVAVGMMKIIDTKSTISWGDEYYDGNGSATITVIDPDENLNCNKVESVPVFIIVNPGSWNQTDSVTVTNFCDLKRKGGYGYDGSAYTNLSASTDTPIRWYNIYNDRYIQYPQTSSQNVVTFDVDTSKWSGYSKVVFYARETGTATGVFQFNINDILSDLGFTTLRVNDVLVAYYLDPNDFDDFSLATAYVGTPSEANNHSATSFTDASLNAMDTYWLGRDPVYVQVIDSNANVDSCCPEQVVVHVCDVHGEDDSEWLIADETSSNSPVFFTNGGTLLLPVWDALGNGFVGKGGYQLKLDNWKLEAFNEDTVYARYNDVYYTNTAMASIGDSDSTTDAAEFPPTIRDFRVANDLSFDLMNIADTQVYDGSTINMYFRDRQANKVSDYFNSDCVFVEVIDPDQNEAVGRRERIAGYWDGHQNFPFGPDESTSHAVNDLLGLNNSFSDTEKYAKLYVLNPRNGKWAVIDLLETEPGSGDFVSVTCVTLVSQYEGVPTLGAKPGDTIIAVYQDPSNHSDSAWISIKVGIGGSGTPSGQPSTTMFVDADGGEVPSYTDTDDVYVKVIDPSKVGEASILDAVEISGTTYDLAPLADADASTGTFITGVITGLGVGTFTATYTDPTDPTDTASDTIDVIASELSIDTFRVGPNPFDTEVTFGYDGTGIAATFSVTVYDLSGHQVWTDTQANVDHVTWDGAGLGNGGYIYVLMATDGTDTVTGKGTVFINK